jgi:hypothetical protein
MRRHRKHHPAVCPLCNGRIDRRTHRKAELLAGKYWHSSCLAALVDAQALAKAAELLKNLSRVPQNQSLDH